MAPPRGLFYVVGNGLCQVFIGCSWEFIFVIAKHSKIKEYLIATLQNCVAKFQEINTEFEVQMAPYKLFVHAVR